MKKSIIAVLLASVFVAAPAYACAPSYAGGVNCIDPMDLPGYIPPPVVVYPPVPVVVTPDPVPVPVVVTPEDGMSTPKPDPAVIAPKPPKVRNFKMPDQHERNRNKTNATDDRF